MNFKNFVFHFIVESVKGSGSKSAIVSFTCLPFTYLPQQALLSKLFPQHIKLWDFLIETILAFILILDELSFDLFENLVLDVLQLNSFSWSIHTLGYFEELLLLLWGYKSPLSVEKLLIVDQARLKSCIHYFSIFNSTSVI